MPGVDRFDGGEDSRWEVEEPGDWRRDDLQGRRG